ncbi:unnamed protein product [Parnassius apollo]|uniref:(apollo) hypothetical protein n=1 Tax=Parnassius apollo TaxID=110799 RepID=A0A8S3WPT5_PARAO|nr:unnamed protein product [Parnassius apollo]
MPVVAAIFTLTFEKTRNDEDDPLVVEAKNQEDKFQQTTRKDEDDSLVVEDKNQEDKLQKTTGTDEDDDSLIVEFGIQE